MKVSSSRSLWDWIELGIVSIVVLYLLLRFGEREQDGWLLAVFIALVLLLFLKIARLAMTTRASGE